ncbi:MAG: hypothetical protein ABSC55_08785 [Syntrophorhabdales bacterium]|jgi:hypothetical protein
MVSVWNHGYAAWREARKLWGAQAACLQYLPDGRWDSSSSWRKDFLTRLHELSDVKVIFRISGPGSRAKLYYCAPDYNHIMDILVATCPDPSNARALERAKSIDKQHVYEALSTFFLLRSIDHLKKVSEKKHPGIG